MPQMTVEQLGQQVQSKFPQYKSVDAAKLGNAVISKYPQYGKLVGTDAAPSSGGQNFDIQGFMKGLLGHVAESAPDVLGTIGNIVGTGGGILAGAAVPGAGETGISEVAGGVEGHELGSAAGQAAGKGIQEFIDQNILGKKKQSVAQNVGDIGKSAGEGLVYGMLPGGQGAASVIKTFGKRFLAGFGVGAGAKAISDIGDKKSLPDNLKDAAFSGTATGILNSVAFPALTSVLKGVFEHAPAKAGQILQDQGALIKKVAVEQPAQLQKDLEDAAIGHRFGIDNVDFAKKNGLVVSPDFTVQGANKELNNVKTMAIDTEKKLQDKLEGVKINAYPIYEEVQKLKGYLPPESSKTAAALDGFMAKVADQNGGRIGVDSQIAAKDVLNLKRLINFDPAKPNSIENQIYVSLKDGIENASGAPKEVKALSNTQHRLSVSATRLKKLINGFDTENKYTLGGIKDAVTEAKKGNITSIAHQLNFLTAPIDMAGYMLGHFPGYIIASHIMPPIKQSIQDNPAFLEKTAGKAATAGKKMVEKAGKRGQNVDQVMRFLRQMGIRMASN